MIAESLNGVEDYGLIRDWHAGHHESLSGNDDWSSLRVVAALAVMGALASLSLLLGLGILANVAQKVKVRFGWRWFLVR